MNKKILLERLMQLDFTAVDLQLYLNTHPTDEETLNYYNSIIYEADCVRQSYEEEFGPLCSFRSMGQHDWPWKNEPWPWKNQ